MNLKLYFLLIISFVQFTVYAQTFERKILTSSDDAEEKFDGSYVTTSSSDLELVYDSWNSQGLQTVGLRFDNIVIPSNANIQNAYIQFTADGNNSGDVILTIKGEKVAESLTFKNEAHNISGRSATVSNVTWNPVPSWFDDGNGADERTPNVSKIVSEIMTSNGWKSGNPITFIITGTGGSNETRRAESFDYGAHVAPKLIIEYTSNKAVDLEVVNISNPKDDMSSNSETEITTEIRNLGYLEASNYNISFSVDGNLVATEQGTKTILEGESITHTFKQKADLSAKGTHVIAVEVTIANDEKTTNNSLTQSVKVSEKAASQIFERQILNSSDDAEEKFNGSYVTTSSSDLELMYDTWNDQGLQTVGLRFVDIAIPVNSTINSAFIQFTADGSLSGDMMISIMGENVAESLTFEDKTHNISSRKTTTSNVAWSNIPSWIDDDNGKNQRTPDVSSIVSEIMTSNHWKTGNPMTFILTGNGSASNFRRAESFDGGVLVAPKLIINYSSNLKVDLEVESSANPTDVIFANASTLVEAEIRSNGNLEATDYTVSFSIDGTLVATEQGKTSIPAGGSMTHTFNQKADFSHLGSHTLEIEVAILNDENTTNNKISKTIEVLNETDQLFFNKKSVWRFWSDNQDPGTLWNTVAYHDDSWAIGQGHFGFGDGDENTTLKTGVVSHYFRKKILVKDIASLNEVYAHVIHDEAAIMYVNGHEVFRSELMPLGKITHTTSARKKNNSTNENGYYTYKIDTSFFVEGENTMAISVRNLNASEDDVSFDAYITPTFSYSQDGPYVYYNGSDIIVEEVTATGIVSNTYTSKDQIQLTCELPHMGKSFSFKLKPEITIEPSIDTETPSKFLAISDFDGHIEGLTMVLKGEGIIDDNFNWTYGDGHLMISGDLFDRGFNITESMWLLYKLESEAEAQGGKVHMIIGNHEMMNMKDDWRYVEVKYFNNAQLMGKRMLELYDSNTELGRWLRSKNIIEKVGDYAFMHGGISPAVSALKLTYDQINEYARMEMNGISCPNSDCRTINGGDGIYWYRGMVNEELTQNQVNTILDGFLVEKVVLGHTKDENIRSLYNDRVLAIDMYHVNNFERGYMKALQFELGCFFAFQTNDIETTYKRLHVDCQQTLGEPVTPNGKNEMKLYPNPTSDFLNIKMPSNTNGNFNYAIVNMQGQTVTQGVINQNLSTIDIRNYAAGQYIIMIQNPERVIKGTFILK